MAKIESLSDIPGIAPLNSNNDRIEAALANTLSRDGSGPNFMKANLDMNGYRVVNLPNAVSNSEPVTLAQAGSIAGVTNPLTQETIGQYLYPQTEAETTASVTIVNPHYPPGDVRRYGAVGDGVTDDTAAINAALLVAQDVSVPTGTYMVEATGTWTGTTNSGATGGLLMRSNQKLTLDKGATLKAIANSSAASNVVRCYNVSNVVIEGGTIQGERAGHLGVTGEHGFGVGIWGSDHVTIQNCTVKDCWGDGIFADQIGADVSSDIVISNVRCTNNRRNGTSIVSASRVRCVNSVFDSQTGTDPQAGFWIEPDVTKSVSDVIVSACDFYNNVGEACGASTVNGVSVSNITFDSCHARNCEYGFVLRDVTEGSISNCLASGCDLYGILVEDCIGVSVTGSLSFNNDRDGLRVLCTGSSCTDVSIYGCVFYSNGTGAYGNGMVAAADATGTYIPSRITVQNSVFRENNLAGLSLAGAADSLVSGCAFSANSQATDDTYANLRLNLVDLTPDPNLNCDRIVVQGNLFLDGGLTNGPNYHVLVSAADNCTISGNDMSDPPTTSALLVSAGTGNVIRDNRGYITEASGTATIASGTTSIAVTHGLSYTPSAGEISLTPVEEGTNDYGRLWVSSLGATTFTVNVSANPGASNLDVGWAVRKV